VQEGDIEGGVQKYYKSGENNFAEMSEEDIEAQLYNLTRYGAIMEFLEPKARSFNNIPQSKNQSQRINCPANDGSFKSHYLTVQSSKN